MAKGVFEHHDYKNYLRELVEERGRGERSRLAETLRCHLAYISQVLGGSADLSPEQAEALNEYFGHSEDEAEFFLLLVSLGRAGSQALRKRCEARLRKILTARTVLENRMKGHKTLPLETQLTYYSSWHYAAIHLLATVPEFQTRERLAARLGVGLAKVHEVVEFLLGAGLLEQQEGRLRTGQVGVFLQNDSPSLVRHHSTWRLQAVQAIERRAPGELHYTSVVSMSAEDLPRIRKIFVDAIEQARAIVRESPEQDAFCYALDFFRV